MSKTTIVSKNAPAPIGPYSHAVLDSFKYRLEISGQSGRDPKTGKLAEGIEIQTEQTLNNIKTILSEVGWKFDSIIKMRIYLTDMKDYSTINKIYEKFFNKDLPSRAVVEVKRLPGDALIEMEAVAGSDEIKKDL